MIFFVEFINSCQGKCVFVVKQVNAPQCNTFIEWTVLELVSRYGLDRAEKPYALEALLTSNTGGTAE